ncbi:MAG TPA: hypothetical protein VFI93_05805 [Rhizomicrobium sp.]|nr:hypothetical protein [Rhizomicrobium sp.]
MNIVLSKLNRGSIAGSQGKTAASSGAILARPSDMLPGRLNGILVWRKS